MVYESKTSYLTSLKEMYTDKDAIKELENEALIEFINDLIKQGKLNKKNYIRSYNSFTSKNKNNEEISEFIQQIEI